MTVSDGGAIPRAWRLSTVADFFPNSGVTARIWLRTGCDSSGDNCQIGACAGATGWYVALASLEASCLADRIG